MTKTKDGVIPRSKLTAHMPPGAATPRIPELPRFTAVTASYTTSRGTTFVQVPPM